MLGPVNMRAELYPLLAHGSQLGERPDLEPARIGEHGTVPATEFVKPAQFLNAFRTRTQHQMISVSQNNICACGPDLIHVNAFDSGCRADWHEGRGGNITSRGL